MKEHITKLLKWRKNNHKNTYKASMKHINTYMQYGGRRLAALPTLDHIRAEINTGKPCIVFLTSRFMSHYIPNCNFHFNVVTGIDEEYVYVLDPMRGYRGGQHVYTHQEFLFAMYATASDDPNSASILTISPR